MKKIFKTVGTLGLVGCAVMNTPFAVADDDSGWLGGLNIGQSRARIDDVGINNQIQGSGLAVTTIAHNDRDRAFKIFAGYKFNKNFALEGGYFNLGRLGYTATTIPTGTQTGYIALKGWNLDAVGILPINEKFSALARFGGSYGQAQDNFTSTGAVAVTTPNPGQNAYNFKAGLGLQYALNESVGLRGEVERFRINDAVGGRGDVDLLSVGLVVAFGQKKQPPVAVAPPPPEPIVAEEMAPLPVMVIVPVLVMTKQYCSILDIQFEIKQGEIQREEKEKLSVVGTFMKKYPDTTAVIEGHTDNVGTDSFNLKLSQQRAESVVAYLISNYHIASNRLSAMGYGASRPIADNRTKEGQQANRRIGAVIACATDIEGLRVAAARLTMALEIEFDPYKSDIAPEYFDELAKVGSFMKANPTVSATVEGHAGKAVGLGHDKERVSAKLAMDVSERRAQNVVNYLVDKQGIARSRLATAAFGSTRRVSYGTSLEGQQENRRVNIIFNYAK